MKYNDLDSQCRDRPWGETGRNGESCDPLAFHLPQLPQVPLLTLVRTIRGQPLPVNLSHEAEVGSELRRHLFPAFRGSNAPGPDCGSPRAWHGAQEGGRAGARG